ncbi:unnamed protein product [Arctia plantaginis]|uniref:Uncharacterized protein n=1 Tax=Arctia plantaginis TaxID=874455 RepID=A0A8S1B200_ARCPL|nr:unnamed protein product [Arctia plantaginis]
MDNTDVLLGGLAGGDKALDAAQIEPNMKRDQDSTDDFEHLERDPKRDSPQKQQAAATRSFLDMEREFLMDAPRAPSADHIADKFTDSESDADTAGESPMHRPVQPAPRTPEPLLDLTPVMAPAPAPAPAPLDPAPASAPAPVEAPSPVPTPLDIPLPEKPQPAATPEPQPEPPKSELPKPEPPKPEPPKQELPKPEPPKPELPKPEPAKREPSPPPKASPPEPSRPTAHVIEAEVIFCQMGLDSRHMTHNDEGLWKAHNVDNEVIPNMKQQRRGCCAGVAGVRRSAAEVAKRQER